MPPQQGRRQQPRAQPAHEGAEDDGQHEEDHQGLAAEIERNGHTQGEHRQRHGDGKTIDEPARLPAEANPLGEGIER